MSPAQPKDSAAKAKLFPLIGIIILVMVVALGIGFYWFIQKQPKKYTGPVEKLRIGIQDNVIVALVLVAQNKGYFTEQSLEVTLKKYPSGKLALLGMFDEEVDLATVADMPVMSNSFDRDDFQILTTIASTGNGAWIVARRDRGIETPRDLRGKRIATQKDSAVHFFLSLFLTFNHLSESKVEISYMEATSLASALIEGKIDAFSMRNPYIKQAKEALGDKAIEFFEPEIYRQTFNLVGKKEYVDEQTEVIERLVKALAEAENFTQNNREQAIETVINQLDSGREQEIADDWDNYSFRVSLDQSLLLTLEDEARWAIKNDLTPATKVPNYLDFIYLDALEVVKPEAITIIR